MKSNSACTNTLKHSTLSYRALSASRRSLTSQIIDCDFSKYVYKVDFGEMGLHIKIKSLAIRWRLLITYRIDDAKEMSGRLQNASEIVGLNININKTEFMTNLVISEDMSLNYNFLT